MGPTKGYNHSSHTQKIGCRGKDSYILVQDLPQGGQNAGSTDAVRGLQAAGDEDCEEEAEEEDGGDVAPDVAAAAGSGQRNADVDRRALHRLPKPAAPKQRPHRSNHLLDALAIQHALRSLPGKDGHLDRPAVCP